MAVVICEYCKTLVDLDWVEGYTGDGEHVFCESCKDDYLEEQEGED